jgi:two-component system sensor histidine kinase/response regulator
MPLMSALTAALVGAAVVVLVLLTTWGMDLLPTLIQGADYSLLITTGVSPAIWIVSLLALLAIIRRRPLTVLDLWLAVMMCAWLLDVSMSAIISSARYDLGWYAGRIYGFLAASFVLIVLLSEINSIQAHLADAGSAKSRSRICRGG